MNNYLPFRQSGCSFLLSGRIHVYNAEVIDNVPHLRIKEKCLKIEKQK